MDDVHNHTRRGGQWVDMTPLILRRLQQWAAVSCLLLLGFGAVAVFSPFPVAVALWLIVALAVAIVRWSAVLPAFRKARGRYPGIPRTLTGLSLLFAVTDGVLLCAGHWVFIQSGNYDTTFALLVSLGTVVMLAAVYLYTPAVLTGLILALLLTAIGLPALAGTPLPLLIAMLFVVLVVAVVVVIAGLQRTPALVARQGEAERSLSNLDSLTGLPNRRQMISEIERAISRSQRQGTYAALVFIDLDYFKDINDTQGHDVGDEVLKEFAARLRTVVRTQDLVARFGGDEFVVLLESLGETMEESRHNVQVVTEKILDVGKALWQVAGISYDLDLSGGIVLFDGHSMTTTELLKSADVAMYQVKQSGRKGLSFYDEVMAAQAEYRLTLLNGLRAGLQRGEFELYFQPIVDGESGIRHVETLLRWHRGGERMMTAAAFMDVLSTSPVINQVGNWVMEQVCEQLAQLRKDGLWEQGASVFVNVSGRQLADAHFANRFFEVLDRYGLPPSLLVVEIAEEAVINKHSETMKQLKALKQRGVGIALDDFGVGYSSLTLLGEVGADYVKLDNDLVGRLHGEGKGQGPVTRTVIDLCKTMGLQVIAEGVENLTQYEHLRSFGCDFFQGYYFHRPMPGSALVGKLGLGSEGIKGLRLVTGDS